MNRKLQRLLALFLTLAMTLTLMSASGWAAETEDEPTEVITEAEAPEEPTDT